MRDTLKILGASNHTEKEREKNDYYATDPDCVKDLLEVESFNHTILEPCCGEGNISKILEENGYEVISTDLVDRGYGKGNIDCFSYTNIDYDIITNPPYSIASEITTHFLNNIKGNHKIALFLKLQFLEGNDRYLNVFKQMHLKTVYIYSRRVACFKNNEMYVKNEDGSFKLDNNGNKIKITSAVCYAWYIFDTSYNGYPTLKWINIPEEKDNRTLF